MEKNKVVETLSNNLQYVYLPNENILTFTLIISFKVGSRDETEEYIGSSHLLEHMLFKGTTRRKYFKTINEEFDELGGSYNATTSKNITNYYIKAPANNLKKCMDLLFDIVFNSIIRSNDLEMEKKVVIEEYHRMLDNNSATCVENAFSSVFQGHPLEKSTIGTKEKILGFQRDKVYEYYKKYYNPANAVVSICGNIGKVSKKQLRNMLEYYTRNSKKNKITSTFSNPVQKIQLPEQKFPRLKIIHKPSAKQCAIVVAFPCMGVYDFENIFILKTFSFILGGGLSSRLFIEIREKAGLAYSIDTETEHYQDTGIFFINTAIEKSSLFNNPNKKGPNDGGLYIVLKTLEKVLKDGVTDEEVNKAKNNFENKISMVYENTHTMAQFYNEQILLKYPKLISIEEFLENIRKVTSGKINKLIRQVLDLKKMSICVSGDYTKKQVYQYLKKRFLKNEKPQILKTTQEHVKAPPHSSKKK
jgi:predicted Zn-dependent peptidase